MTLTRQPTIEGAGVHLNRVFGYSQSPRFDPFLMLDDFRSNTPAHYLKGFPWHPHLTRNIAFDLGPKGIRVNAIAPGAIKTTALESVLTPEIEKAMLKHSGYNLCHFSMNEERGDSRTIHHDLKNRGLLLYIPTAF
jgi:hypothetical protein